MNLPTVQQVAQFIDNAMRQAIDPNGTGAYDNSAGSDNAALISVLTQVAMGTYNYAADRKRASVPSAATGSDLDDILRDDYLDGRKGTNAATTTLYLKRTAGGMPATSIPAGTRFGSQNTGTTQAVQFEATTTVAAASALDRVPVPVVCLIEGSVGNVQLVAINQILDQLGDPNWFLYVPAPGDPVLGSKPAPDTVSGGADEETDDQAKARVLVRPARVAKGTAAGVYKGTTDVGGIATAVPVEVGDGTGIVYAGDINFNLSSAQQQAVATNLEDWRPFGVPVAARAMNVIPVQVTLQIYMQRPIKNYNINQLLANAQAAVQHYFDVERKRPDEYFINAIQTAAGKSNPETQTVIVLSPATDQKRPADSTYGSIIALTRYTVSAATISIQFFDPQTS